MATSTVINIMYEEAPQQTPPPGETPPPGGTPDTRTTCEKYPDLPECKSGGGAGVSTAPTISAINTSNLGGNLIRATATGTNYKSGAIAMV